MMYAIIIYSFQSYDNWYLFNVLLTSNFGLYNNLGADTLGNHPSVMKSSMMHDLDTPWFFMKQCTVSTNTTSLKQQSNRLMSWNNKILEKL